MAPSILVGRYYGNDCDYNGVDSYDDCYYSPWDSWGRWVALAAIIVFVIFVALVFSCFNAKRRRRQGLPPRYGTGWTTNRWGNNGQPSYYNNNNNQQPYNGAAAAPPYSPPVQNQYTGNTYNSNEGYYGQQSGIELQHPQNTYAPQNGGQNVYGQEQVPKKHPY